MYEIDTQARLGRQPFLRKMSPARVLACASALPTPVEMKHALPYMR